MQTQRNVDSRHPAPDANRPEADYRTSNLLATVAHELRGPLMSVLNSLAILHRADKDGATRDRALTVIERQAHQMKRLVDDLLDSSPMTAARIEIQRADVDLGLLLEQSVEAIRPVFEDGGRTLTLSLPAPLRVVGDAGRLTQVFANLLDNAGKYTPRGGHVSVSMEREGRAALVRVADDGIGIPAMWLERIFERFVQVAPSGAGARGGLGIGLALARQLVELHGGTITADSRGSCRGSRFTVRLPAASSSRQQPSI